MHEKLHGLKNVVRIPRVVAALAVMVILLTGIGAAQQSSDRGSVEETAWQSAEKTRTVDALQAFLEKYPTSSHAQQTQGMIADINDWEAIEHTVSRDAYNNYLQQHANGLFVAQAQGRVQDISFWQVVRKSHDPAMTDSYVQMFPSGLFISQVAAERQRIDQLQQQQRQKEVAVAQAAENDRRNREAVERYNRLVSEAKEDQSKTTWTDPSTGLMWTKNESDYEMKWKDAERYCKDLRLEDYSDWRLPKSMELTQIHTVSANILQRYVEGNLKVGDNEWSSDTFHDWSSMGVRQAYIESFREPGDAPGYSKSTWDLAGTWAVLCVRKAQ